MELGQEMALAACSVAFRGGVLALSVSQFEGMGGELFAEIVGPLLRANVGGELLGLMQCGGELWVGTAAKPHSLLTDMENAAGAHDGPALANVRNKSGKTSGNVGGVGHGGNPSRRCAGAQDGCSSPRHIGRGLVVML
jgi:hypothetical protein